MQEPKRLTEWAKEKNIPYATAYSKYQRGQINATKTSDGIIVSEGAQVPDTQSNIPTIVLSNNPRTKQALDNLSVAGVGLTDLKSSLGSTSSRRNAASTIEKTDRYININNCPLPYQTRICNGGKYLSMRDVCLLVSKAYFSFGSIRNHINVLAEFSSSEVYLTGGSKASRDFFDALFDKINLNSFIEQFFLEFWRSSNCFIYRFDGILQDEDITDLTKVFSLSSAKKGTKLPIKYTLLNPADILLSSQASMVMGNYYKELNQYEISALRNPQTDQDKDLFDSLPSDVKKQINERKTTNILLKLPTDKIKVIFNKKQDYEGFAVSIIYPVLDDLEVKTEMKKMDAALTRTTQQIVLLVTIGSELKDGTLNINQKNIDALQKIFEQESVGRVLISDFTTQVSFITPDISNLLDPKKYAQIDKDIKDGLGSILLGTGDEKFANRSMMVQIFVERLIKSRRAFLDNFLMPEIKRIAKEMGFKNFPTAYFKELNLKDELEFSKLYIRMAELGLLSADETVEALESGRLPTPEESLEAQEKYKESKDKGFYQPVAGGPATQMDALKETNKGAQKLQQTQLDHDAEQQQKQRTHEAKNPPPPTPNPIHFNFGPKVAKQSGRPSGTSSPKTKQKVKPVGASFEGAEFSAQKVKDTLILATQLQNKIEDSLKEKHGLKELNAKQKEIADQLSETIVINEEKDKWLDSEIIGSYLENPLDKNQERVNEVNDIACEHNLSYYMGAILFHSKIENNE